jgi:iron-sulfur cluster repair protein YtfE (RIC family)
MATPVDIRPVSVARPLDPLREEHRELAVTIARLRKVADGIGRDTRIRAEIDDLYASLAQHLIPHAVAEDEVLYAEVDRALGSPDATAPMRRDHTAVARLVDELGVLRHFADEGPTVDHANDLRRVLYGLHALVSVHFGTEEEVYLPLLDERLSLDEGSRLLGAMERTASAVRQRMPA